MVWEDTTAKTVAFLCRREPVRVDQRLIGELKAVSSQRGGANVRLCLHDSPEALFHEMIILERAGKYYRPHKHLAKGESYHIIEGELGVCVFDEQGAVADACVLTPHGTVAYRVGRAMYHMIVPLSSLVIYHESKPGPFIRSSDCAYAAWAPTGDDAAAVTAFIERVRELVQRGQQT